MLNLGDSVIFIALNLKAITLNHDKFEMVSKTSNLNCALYVCNCQFDILKIISVEAHCHQIHLEDILS